MEWLVGFVLFCALVSWLGTRASWSLARKLEGAEVQVLAVRVGPVETTGRLVRVELRIRPARPLEGPLEGWRPARLDLAPASGPLRLTFLQGALRGLGPKIAVIDSEDGFAGDVPPSNRVRLTRSARLSFEARIPPDVEAVSVVYNLVRLGAPIDVTREFEAVEESSPPTAGPARAPVPEQRPYLLGIHSEEARLVPLPPGDILEEPLAPPAPEAPLVLCGPSPVRTVRRVGKQVWVGTDGSGVLLFENARRVAHYTVRDFLPSNEVSAVGTDHEGRVLLGTGAGVLTRTENGWLRRRFVRNAATAPRADGTSFLTTPEELWWGVGGDAYVFRPREGRWYRLDGLGNIGVYRLLGTDGALWFHAQQAYARYGDEWLRFHFPTLNWALRTHVLGPGGTLYLGTTVGVFRFPPESWPGRVSEDDLRKRLLPVQGRTVPLPIRALLHDGERLWADTEDGLHRQEGDRLVPSDAWNELEARWLEAEPPRVDDQWAGLAERWIRLDPPAWDLPSGRILEFVGDLALTDAGLLRWVAGAWGVGPFEEAVNARLQPRRWSGDLRAVPRLLLERRGPEECFVLQWTGEALTLLHWAGEQLRELDSEGLPQHPPSGFVAGAVATEGGGVAFRNGSGWAVHRKREGLGSLEVRGLQQDPWGRFWAHLWGGTFLLEGGRWSEQRLVIPGWVGARVHRFHFLQSALLIEVLSGRGSKELLLVRPEGTRRLMPEGFEVLNLQRCVVHGDRLLLLAHPAAKDRPLGNGVYGYGELHLQPLWLEDDLGARLRDLTVTPDGTVWAATSNGLFRLGGVGEATPLPPSAARVDLRPLLDGCFPPAAPPEPEKPAGPRAQHPLLEKAREYGLLQDVTDKEWQTARIVGLDERGMDEGQEDLAGLLQVLYSHHGMVAEWKAIGAEFLEEALGLVNRLGVEVEMAEEPAPKNWEEPFVVRLMARPEELAFTVDDPGKAHARILQQLNSLLERRGRAERFYATYVDTGSEFILVPETAAPWLEDQGAPLIRLGMAGDPVPDDWG